MRDLDGALATLAAEGSVVVPGVLTDAEVRDARYRLWAASAESERRGVPTHKVGLDPNASNVRVFNLIDLDPFFADLLEQPVAAGVVERLLGPHYIVSNISANIARPGSQPMALHSDQALIHPGPWPEPWAVNVIWCLDDVHAANGATRHVPGSHRFTSRDDLPADLAERLVPFEAPAGSAIVMDGRVWHTSGANTTADEDRAMVFAYYTAPFVRPQWNFTAALRPEVQAAMSPRLRHLLGLDILLNRPTGTELRLPVSTS